MRTENTPTTPAPAVRPLLSTRQISERLGMSRTAVYDLLASGQMETVRINNRLRVEPAVLEAFIDRHRVPAFAAR